MPKQSESLIGEIRILVESFRKDWVSQIESPDKDQRANIMKFHRIMEGLRTGWGSSVYKVAPSYEDDNSAINTTLNRELQDRLTALWKTKGVFVDQTIFNKQVDSLLDGMERVVPTVINDKVVDQPSGNEQVLYQLMRFYNEFHHSPYRYLGQQNLISSREENEKEEGVYPLWPLQIKGLKKALDKSLAYLDNLDKHTAALLKALSGKLNTFVNAHPLNRNLDENYLTPQELETVKDIVEITESLYVRLQGKN